MHIKKRFQFFSLAVFSAAPTLILAEVLPVTDGLLCQLDATDAAAIYYDGDNKITTWSSSQGSTPITMSRVTGFSFISPPTYQVGGGGNNNLPCVKFVATTNPSLSIQKLVSGPITAVPRSVFIMMNADSPPGVGLGGIWGRNGVDQGIRFWSDNGPGSPYGPANTHQLVNAAIVGGDNRFLDFGLNSPGDNGQPAQTENYYWSDTTIIDARQTWQPMNWGTLGAYRYTTALGGAGNWTQGIALGNYYNPNEGRSWSGQIGEVLVYDRWLSDAERQAVETYLSNKWLSFASAPYETWAAARITAINPSADAARDMDPDNDGVVNVLEFYLDGDPLVGDSPQVTPSVSGGSAIFTFFRRDGAVTEPIVLQSASDPDQFWSNIQNGVDGISITSEENGTNPDSMTVTIPLGADPRKFFRLAYIQPPPG